MFEEVMREESRIFRVNTGTIPPSEVEAFLAKIKSEYKKSPIMHFQQNLYKRTLITEKVEKFAHLNVVVEDYFIPVR